MNRHETQTNAASSVRSFQPFYSKSNGNGKHQGKGDASQQYFLCTSLRCLEFGHGFDIFRSMSAYVHISQRVRTKFVKLTLFDTRADDLIDFFMRELSLIK